MFEFFEACRLQQGAPAIHVVVGAVAAAVPAFLVAAAGVGAEQDAAGFEGGAQVTQDAGQSLRGDVEQDGVGEDAVEAGGGQLQAQEALVPDLAAAGGAAMATKLGVPSRPTARWPRAVKVLRSRPGPQPRSRMSQGGSPSMWRSSAAMFWLTS